MMASFEAKLSAISIVGVKDGEAMSCTKCDPGFQSNDGNTDCQVCPKGTYSSAATSSCTLCPDGTFADQVSMSLKAAHSRLRPIYDSSQPVYDR